MKVKNIMFTGFMAAILGATSANAAISVASTGYVDNKIAPLATSQSVTDLGTSVANTYQTKQDAETMQNAINARVTTETYNAHLTAQDAIDDKQTEDIGKNTAAIATLNGDADTPGSVDNKIQVLSEALGGTTGDLTNLTSKVTANTNAITTLNADENTEGSVAFDIAAALVEANNYTDTEVKELAEGTVATNTSNIAANTAAIATKADKATTLAGYGIDNAYTKDEVNDQIANSITEFDTGLKDIKDTVTALPTTYAPIDTVEEAEQAAIDTAEQNAKDFTSEQIATLDSSKAAAAGSVLSGVTMVDGKITEVQQVALGKLATANVPAECTNESGTMCVLAVTPDAGADGGFIYSWTPITETSNP